MIKVEIVLTNDYEIFGNGSGDVRYCLIEPTNRLLEIADKYNIPITIMAEICEYWAFKSEEQKGNLPKRYKPATWIEEQLIRCIKTNHDVQLHVHPQWMNFVYHPDKNEWEVDFDYWRVSSLSYEKMCAILKRGKQELEALLRPFKLDYECFAFRAGAWSIQPEVHVLKALFDVGFKVDTTVAPGCYFESPLSYFDFRALHHKPYWFVKEGIKEEAMTGILELPIYTRKYFLHDKAYYRLLRKLKKVNTIPRNCRGTLAAEPKKRFIKKLWPRYTMFDFCVMSDSEMMLMLKDAEREFRDYDVIPVVVIGHSKAFNNTNNLGSFIKKALNEGYTFSTFKHLTNKITSN